MNTNDIEKSRQIKKVESLEILGENKKNVNEENFVVIEVLKKEFLEVVKRGEKLWNMWKIWRA